MTHSWVTRQIFWGEQISVKQAHKNILGNIANDFVRKACFEFCMVSSTYLGQRAYQTYIIAVHVWSVHGAAFKTCWQLAWRAKGNTRRLIETFE